METATRKRTVEVTTVAMVTVVYDDMLVVLMYLRSL